jgi:hypothetical protein
MRSFDRKSSLQARTVLNGFLSAYALASANGLLCEGLNIIKNKMTVKEAIDALVFLLEAI